MYPPSFYNILKDSDKSFIQSLGQVMNEREVRLTRTSSVEMYDYEPTDINAETHLAWSGSIGMVVAPKGSAILDRFRKILTSGGKGDIELANELKNDAAAKQPVPYDEAVQLLLETPVFASLKYKGKILSSAIFVPDGFKAYTAGIPYNGGSLDPAGFELVEHLKTGSETEELAAIILRRPPKLTDAEQFAVNSLKNDELNVGIGIMCYAASAVTITLGMCAATGMTCPHSTAYKRGLKNPEPDVSLQSASPELIARKLLNTRREIIEGIIK